MRSFILRPLTAAAIVAVIFAQQWLAADDSGSATRKRALPPKNWEKRVVDSFFSDAKSTLDGTRPDFGTGGKGPVAGSLGGDNPASPGGDTPDASAGGAGVWSKLVTADALQDEIKSYQSAVQTDVKNPSEFKGNLFGKHARDDFTMLALAFAVISEYDGDVRWKAQALAARNLFGRAGFNCKVGTDQSFNEAKSRAEDLAALIRGDTIQEPAGADPKAAWAKTVANRPPLMHRLDAAQNKLSAVTSNPNDFAKKLDQVDHEAQIVAIIAEAIQREGYEFTDDKSYLGFAREMEKQALSVSAAARAKNADQARLAVGAISKACSNCHGGFRS